MQAANKNPPWARAPGGNMDMNQGNMGGGGGGMMQYGGAAGGVYAQGMMQNAGANMMGMQGGVPMGPMAGGAMYPGNVVAYPTPRAMNSGGFPAQAQSAAAEQRVFTGTVTKTHNDFGFVDHDVFYQTSVCSKGVLPKVNDRVLVEATYNANMPFKWNATRVQVLNKSGQQNSTSGGGGGGYNAVPPPNRDSGRGGSSADRFSKSGNTARRDDRPPPRKSAPAKRTRSRSKSPVRPAKRRDSPPRKRAPRRSVSPPPKYVVRVPRIPLDISDMDVTSMTQRYSNLYIPSDFFASSVRWSEAFPPQCPFSLHNPCSFHVMNKEIPNPMANDSVLEPPDADYRFSAKVMLISLPNLESLYQKCGLTKSDSKDKRDSKAVLHPTRLIKFLVGQKGKGGDSFAIGGPWSPSLDGPNPESDPSVLVKTAIRTTKALTGIDLTPCTQWFRMVEFYYWREGSGEQKSRLETVVLFLPDVWSAMPSRPDWTCVQDTYKKALEHRLNPPAQPTEEAAADDSKIESLNESKSEADVSKSEDTSMMEETGNKSKQEPTHYSKLDVKNIKVTQIREELEARDQSSKGLRAQLLARLVKCLKQEEEEEKKKEKAETEEKEKEVEEVVEISDDKDKEEEVKKDEKETKEEVKKMDEKEISQLRSRYGLPNSPQLIAHPSTTARGGKFNCNLATLSLLLDYRITDNKEHSFEIFVFAELFNEMLQRDFGFYIYKTLYTLPERVEEEKEKERKADKEKKDEKKEDKKEEDKKEEKKEDGKDKKEDKKDDGKDKKKEKDHRESKERESRDGSPTPRRHSRGVELPTDPYMLLSLVYFDTSRCGYVVRRDLQTLFMALGLQLSRSQVKTVLDKVCVKENFSYKTLMNQIKELSNGTSEALQDMPLDSVAPAGAPVTPVVAELEATIAAGNRDLRPVFNDGFDSSSGEEGGSREVGDSGMVIYKKRLVDVGATLTALAKSEQTRTRLENALAEARSVARVLRSGASTQTNIIKSLQSQLTETNNQLSVTKSRLSAVTASSRIFHGALKTIQTKVDAVININFEEDVNDEVEIVNGPAKLVANEKEDEKIKTEAKCEPQEPVKEEASSEEASQPSDIKLEETDDKEQLTDVLQSENMDIDDK